MPSTPSDISLAVGDGARRMTYAELAAVRGTSQASAERLVRRRHWPRQVGNDGVVRVLVPLAEAKNPRERTVLEVAPDTDGPPPGQSAPDAPRTVRTLESAVEALRDQLVRAEQRADADRSRVERAERHLEEERGRIDEERKRVDELRTSLTELQAALADAIAAERITAAVAAGLRAELDRRLDWRAPWWRRWFR
jgi:hypothetical protein